MIDWDFSGVFKNDAISKVNLFKVTLNNICAINCSVLLCENLRGLWFNFYHGGHKVFHRETQSQTNLYFQKCLCESLRSFFVVILITVKQK